jgi:hypothetical protein
MRDINSRKTSVALESPSYYASLQLKNKNKTNKQTKFHASFPKNIESFDNQKRKRRKTFFFTNPKKFYLSTFVLKEEEKQKKQKIKPSHYKQ